MSQVSSGNPFIAPLNKTPTVTSRPMNKSPNEMEISSTEARHTARTKGNVQLSIGPTQLS